MYERPGLVAQRAKGRSELLPALRTRGGTMDRSRPARNPQRTGPVRRLVDGVRRPGARSTGRGGIRGEPALEDRGVPDRGGQGPTRNRHRQPLCPIAGDDRRLHAKHLQRHDAVRRHRQFSQVVLPAMGGRLRRRVGVGFFGAGSGDWSKRPTPAWRLAAGSWSTSNKPRPIWP